MEQDGDPFILSAQYFDLLYADRNTVAEVNFLTDLFQWQGHETILDLGCGTGRHAFELARRGHKVTAIDVSSCMLEVAQRRRSAQDEIIQQRTFFECSDVRKLNLGKKFDSVVSLFHVASTFTTNQDFDLFLKTIETHLGSGGKFLFDFWFAPAVFTQQPSVRTKVVEDEVERITRTAFPTINPETKVIDVRYEFIVNRKLSQRALCGPADTLNNVDGIKNDGTLPSESRRTFSETHHMRCFEVSEIEQSLPKHRLKCEQQAEWGTGKAPTENTWSVFVSGSLS